MYQVTQDGAQGGIAVGAFGGFRDAPHGILLGKRQVVPVIFKMRLQFLQGALFDFRWVERAVILQGIESVEAGHLGAQRITADQAVNKILGFFGQGQPGRQSWRADGLAGFVFGQQSQEKRSKDIKEWAGENFLRASRVGELDQRAGRSGNISQLVTPGCRAQSVEEVYIQAGIGAQAFEFVQD